MLEKDIVYESDTAIQFKDDQIFAEIEGILKTG